jgi:lipopolysaccharide transport system permease protein
MTTPVEPTRVAGSLPVRILRPRPHIRALSDLFSVLVHQRRITLAMARREITVEHSGKAFGAVWGVIQPLFILSVYAFIYGVVFHQKVGGTYALPRNFTIYLLSGLVPWFAFQYSMAKGTTAIAGNATLVKQVIFDLDILPIAATVTACVTLVLGLTFLVGYTIIVYHAVPWTYVLAPVAFGLQFGAMCGAAFLLAALGVFLRDVRDVVQLSSIVLIFLMPIVYLPGEVPAAFSPLLWLNPFTYMVYCYQDVFYYGRIEHPYSWLAFVLLTVFTLTSGFRLFKRVKPYFGDVL